MNSSYLSNIGEYKIIYQEVFLPKYSLTSIYNYIVHAWNNLSENPSIIYCLLNYIPASKSLGSIFDLTTF
jgi:ABC-type phosphate transport system permease subunit